MKTVVIDGREYLASEIIMVGRLEDWDSERCIKQEKKQARIWGDDAVIEPAQYEKYHASEFCILLRTGNTNGFYYENATDRAKQDHAAAVAALRGV